LKYQVNFSVSEDMYAEVEADSIEEARQKFLNRFTMDGEFDPTANAIALHADAETETGPYVNINSIE
jgi:hypothetical protein